MIKLGFVFETIVINKHYYNLYCTAAMFCCFFRNREFPLRRCYTVKKFNDFPVCSQDVTNQTLHGREKFIYSRPGRVWFVTSRLGTGKSLTFFCSVYSGLRFWRHDPDLDFLLISRVPDPDHLQIMFNRCLSVAS